MKILDDLSVFNDLTVAGTATAAAFSGPLTGAVTGNCSGSAGALALPAGGYYLYNALSSGLATYAWAGWTDAFQWATGPGVGGGPLAEYWTGAYWTTWAIDCRGLFSGAGYLSIPGSLPYLNTRYTFITPAWFGGGTLAIQIEWTATFAGALTYTLESSVDGSSWATVIGPTVQVVGTAPATIMAPGVPHARNTYWRVTIDYGASTGNQQINFIRCLTSRSSVNFWGWPATWDVNKGVTLAGALTVPANISLSGWASNWVAWNSNGVGAPTVNTSSVGTKLILYPAVSSSSVDYAIGVESGGLWSSVANSAGHFSWYAGTTSIMSLSGTTGILTATGFSGALTGNATSASAVAVSASSATVYYVPLCTGATGNQSLHASTGLTFNPTLYYGLFCGYPVALGSTAFQPNASLHINGTLGNCNRLFQMNSIPTTGAGYGIILGGNQWYTLGVGTDGIFRVATGADAITANQLTVNTSGQVGVGTAAQTTALGVVGDTNISGTLTVGNLVLPLSRPGSPVNGSCYWENTTEKFWIYSSIYGWRSTTLT